MADLLAAIHAAPLGRSDRKIVASAVENVEPPTLPPEVRDAFLKLDREADLGAGGAAAAPGADREPFDPEATYQALRDEAPSFGSAGGGVLDGLRTLSFWKMKDRARKFGERQRGWCITRSRKSNLSRFDNVGDDDRQVLNCRPPLTVAGRDLNEVHVIGVCVGRVLVIGSVDERQLS